MLPNEDFINHVEENFIHWDDDADMMIITRLRVFFKKPGTSISMKYSQMKSGNSLKTCLLECK